MMTTTDLGERKLTGWHVLAMFVAFFGVIIAVNVTLAWKAIATFPGVEVENGYVASQSFDKDRAAQKALDWTLTPGYDAAAHAVAAGVSGRCGPARHSWRRCRFWSGAPPRPRTISGPSLCSVDGVYVAPASLAMGKWMMAVEARADDGTLFHQRLDLHVRP